MKNQGIIIVLLAMLCPIVAKAQLRVGPTIGFNLSSAQYSKEWREDIRDDGGKNQPVLRLQIGVTGEYALTDQLYVQSGLLINGAGGKTKVDYSDFGYEAKSTEKILLTYLDIPLTARYQLTEGDGFSLSGWGGFIVGFAVSGKFKSVSRVEGEREDSNESIEFGSSRYDDLKGGDFRLALGAVAESEDFPIQLKIALQQGLADIYPDNNFDYGLRNFMFSLSASYFFELE